MRTAAIGLFAFIAIAASLAGFPSDVRAGAPAELAGGPDGRLHLIVDGTEMCGFSPFVADGAWKFYWPTAVQAPPDTPFRFELKFGQNTIPGKIDVTEKHGNAEVVWTFTSPIDVSFNSLSINSDIAIATLAGGMWETDSQRGAFPRVFGDQKVFSGKVRSLSITYADGQAVTFLFPQPINVGLQDNRKWGGQTFSLRIGGGIGRLAARESYALAMTITVPDGLRYRRDLPVTLVASNEWVPLKTEIDIVPGSALDLSACGFTDGPCGAKGRVIATPDGHFAYADDPKTPRRFYGINLCFSSQYLPKEQVDRLLDRLVRLGYNTLRIHHYEYRLTNPDWKPGFDWDPARVDQLDYLMAGCARRGLWITTDLFVSRPVPGKQIGLPGDRADPNRFKVLVPVYEPAYQDWVTFARKFLDRVNPYTGKRIAESPALAWVSLINEGPVANHWGEARRIPEWTAAWNRWLASRYPDRDDLDVALGDLTASEDPKDGNVALPVNIKGGVRRARAAQVFLADTEKAMFARMRSFLRDDIRCPALLTDLNNGGPGIVPMQAARAEFDYVDEHFYVGHPVFLDKQWQLPSSCPNTNPVREGAPGSSGNACVRLWGKPFTISEFNYSGPGRFRGVGGILTGAMGALQDWDALWRFAYSHTDNGLFDPAPLDYFNLVRDPLNQAADRAAVFLYLRRDLKPAPHRIAAILPREMLRNPPGRLALNGLESAAWLTRIGCLVVDDSRQVPADAIAMPFEDARDSATVAGVLNASKALPPQPDNDVIRSETGEIAIDRKRGVLTVDTLRTAGGYADAGQTIVASRGGITVSGITAGATVFVSSLDTNPIRSCERLLVTHLTDLQNTGASYGESTRQTLLDWGGLPHLVLDGAATIRITLSKPAAYSVWALSTGGRRLERVESRAESGALIFTARVRGSDGARILYEVTR